MHFCSICNRDIESEVPTVLTMGRSMTPRYICPECEGLLDTALTSRETADIRDAIGKLGELLTKNDCEDGSVIATVTAHLKAADERADAIEAGTYDFSLDEEEEEEFEITEDLMETEEDRELDRADEEKEKRIDKFLNWTWVGVGIGVVAYFVWFIFFR